MAVDVSNLVNMLATQPGQNIANLGATLLGAQEAVRNREAQAQKLAIEQRKLKLEEDLAKQKITLGEIELKGKQGEIASALSQSMLTAKDPMVKQQILASQVPLLKATGVPDEQLKFMAQNINNNDMWNGLQVYGLAANEFWKDMQTKDVPTTADDFTRAVAMRDRITKQLKTSPNDPQLKQTLEDVNARIAKLTSQGLSPTAKAGLEEAAKGRAKYLQSGAEAVRENAVNASDSVQNLTIAKNILTQGLETGAFQPAISGVNKYLVDAGIEIPGLNKVEDVEVFNTMMSREIVTELANMDKPSDKDAELVRNMTASIKNTEQAARFLIDAAIATKERKIEKHSFYEDYWQTHKSYETETSSVEKAWADYVNKTPLVGKRKDGFTVSWPEFKQAYQKKWPEDSLNDVINVWNTEYAH